MKIPPKKTIRACFNLSIIVGLIIYMVIYWYYKRGAIQKNEVMFWLCVFAAWASLSDLIFSVLYKESVAKGIIVSKGQSLYSFIVSVIASLVIFLLSIIGIVHFY